MSAIDILVLVAVIGAVLYGANLYLRRPRSAQPAPATAGGGSAPRAIAKSEERPPATTERVSSRREKSGPKASEPKLAAAKPEKEDMARERPHEKKPSDPKLAKAEAADAAETKAATAPAAEDPAAAPPSLPKLYKEEEDESLDPTRVGAFEAVGDDHGDEADGDGSTAPAPIERILHDDDADADEPTRVQSFFLLYAMAQTDKGLRRENNEDSMLILEKASLFAVADGMGGHRGGEHASQLAMKVLEETFDKNVFHGPPYDNLPRQGSELARAIDLANRRIHYEGSKDKRLEGMGTTICAARFAPNKNRLFIGHVGDSRCYRLRGGVLEQMTKDHTMAELGVTGPEGKNLARALGVFPVVPIDVIVARPAVNDIYLLCSDGLTKMLSDEVIANVLRHETDLKSAVERLVLFANGHGGKDNITVVLVRVAPPPGRQLKKTIVGTG